MRIFVMSAAALALCGCVPNAPSPDVLATAKAVQWTDADKRELTRILSAGLKDPDSAKFKWPPLLDVKRAEGFYNYCGMLNAKNSYGGYIGYQPFYAQVGRKPDGSISFAEMRGIGDGDAANPIPDLCAGYGYAGLLSGL